MDCLNSCPPILITPRALFTSLPAPIIGPPNILSPGPHLDGKSAFSAKLGRLYREGPGSGVGGLRRYDGWRIPCRFLLYR